MSALIEKARKSLELRTREEPAPVDGGVRALAGGLGGAARSRGPAPARGSAAPAVRVLRSLRAAVEEPATRAWAHERVRAWHEGYPDARGPFRDADGRSPAHTRSSSRARSTGPAYLDALADLARRGFGEVELHLHHDGDTAEKLRRTIADYLGGSRSTDTCRARPAGRMRYAFIHGNWCLANARSDGRWCGVDDELPLLHRHRLLRRLHLPGRARRVAAADRQPDLLAGGRPGAAARVRARRARARRRGAARSHPDDRGAARVRGAAPTGTGCPSRASRTRRSPPTIRRRRRGCGPGCAQGIHVDGRPEWVFVKVHTHGAPEAQAASLLGERRRADARRADHALQRRRALAPALRDRARDVQHRDRRDGRPGGRSRQLPRLRPCRRPRLPRSPGARNPALLVLSCGGRRARE